MELKELTMLRERLGEEVKVAMKAKDARRVATIRLILAAIKDRDIANRGDGKDAVDNAGVLEILQKMVKQRRESILAFEAGGRLELAKQESDEIEIISSFMPAQMTDAETVAATKAAIEEVGAAGLKDIGKVMALLKEKYAGRMDFGKASPQVRQLLS